MQRIFIVCNFFLQDLKVQLWEISDERKLEAEAERQSVINEGWLEDRLGLLTNHYLTLMQVSMLSKISDLFQDACFSVFKKIDEI